MELSAVVVAMVGCLMLGRFVVDQTLGPLGDDWRAFGLVTVLLTLVYFGVAVYMFGTLLRQQLGS